MTDTFARHLRMWLGYLGADLIVLGLFSMPGSISAYYDMGPYCNVGGDPSMPKG